MAVALVTNHDPTTARRRTGLRVSTTARCCAWNSYVTSIQPVTRRALSTPGLAASHA
jgi:hypothetical protein